MLGKPCNHDPKFICFKWGACTFPTLMECLKAGIVMYAREVEGLKKRQMLKHSEATIKWRNQSFYYKRKARALEAFLTSQGYEIPTPKEVNDILAPLTTDPNTKEVNNGTDKVSGSNKGKVELKRRTPRGASNKTGSNNDSSKGIQSEAVE